MASRRVSGIVGSLWLVAKLNMQGARVRGFFFASVAAFYVLWVANAYVRFPIADLRVGEAIATVLFMVLPLTALYFGGAMQWRPAVSAIVFLCCVIVVAVFAFGVHRSPNAYESGVLQIARLGWPMALGFLISGLIKDKNLLLPIAIVLGTVDILAVFAPMGTVRQGLQSPAIRPIFDALAFQVPKFGSVTPAAQMGPADPLFLGMFFYALHKFGMRTRETFYWVVPALLIYLLIVLLFGNASIGGISLRALPALVPIGLAVVVANRKEFSMSRDERRMTLGVAALCVCLLVLGFVRLRYRTP